MNILVPTDFSEHAQNAVDAAIKMAKYLGGQIHLYHSAAIPDDWEKLSVEEKFLDDLNKKIAIAARDKLNAIKERVEEKGIAAYTHYTGGSFIKNIHEILDQVPIDLIIMGSHGASGKREWLIGTKTQKVIRRVDTMTLVVKTNQHKLDFSKVLFVTGLSEDDQSAFRRFLAFLEPFRIEELHILSIDLQGAFTNPRFLMVQLLKEFKAVASKYNTFTYFFSALTVDMGVRQFVHAHGIDLVAMSNHHEKPLKHALLGSNIERVVNHSDVPVLSIDFN